MCRHINTDTIETSGLTWKQFIFAYLALWAIVMGAILTVAYLVLPHN